MSIELSCDDSIKFFIFVNDLIDSNLVDSVFFLGLIFPYFRKFQSKLQFENIPFSCNWISPHPYINMSNPNSKILLLIFPNI